MALIKGQHAGELIREAVVLDLGDLQRQAAELKARAQAEADRIVADARAEAQRLTEGAEQRGYDAGFTQGRAEGYPAGEKAGKEQALREAASSLAAIEQAWSEAADRFESERRDMHVEARQSLLQLTLAMAEKIVKRVPAVAPDVVVEQVAEAIDHVARPCDLTVRLHPEDRPLVAEAMPKLAARLDQAQHVELVDDETLTRGGCTIRYGKGRIDATLETQLQRLVEAILPAGEQPDDPQAPTTPNS